MSYAMKETKAGPVPALKTKVASEDFSVDLRKSELDDSFQQHYWSLSNMVIHNQDARSGLGPPGNGRAKTSSVKPRAVTLANSSFSADVMGSSGEPLDSGIRETMQACFDHDFSDVRIHTSEGPVESARNLHAKAYTVGRNIVFGRNRYSPHTGEGQQLLAHEMAHVVQQSLPNPSSPGHVHEREATSASQQAASAKPFRIVHASVPGMPQRAEEPAPQKKARLIFVDANIILEGGAAAKAKVEELRKDGAKITVTVTTYRELIDRAPDAAKKARNLQLLKDFGIDINAAETSPRGSMADRVNVYARNIAEPKDDGTGKIRETVNNKKSGLLKPDPILSEPDEGLLFPRDQTPGVKPKKDKCRVVFKSGLLCASKSGLD
jgi:hypothetical protein